MRHRRKSDHDAQDVRRTPGTPEAAGLPTPEDDTDARWEPIPDEVWFTSPAGRPVASDADGTDAGLDLPDLRMPVASSTPAEPVAPVPATASAPTVAAGPIERAESAPNGARPETLDDSSLTSTGPDEPTRVVRHDTATVRCDDAEATRLLTPESADAATTPRADGNAVAAPANAPATTGSAGAAEGTTPATTPDPLGATVVAGAMPPAATTPRAPEPLADRTQLVGAGNPYRVARPAGAPAPDGATVRRQPAAAPAPDAPGRTQVWAAPYAGMGGGYDDASPDATTTARRPSLLRRNRARRRPDGGVGQIPYGASTDGPRGPYDGSPVPPAEGGRTPRRRWRDRKRARHGCLSLLLWLVMLAVAGVMALRTLPSEQANGSMVPELVAFVPWLFAPIVVCLLLALLWRRRLLAVCCAAAFAVMAWWHVGFFVPTARVSSDAVAAAAGSVSTGDNVARVMTVNTNHGMASAAEIVEICREQNVEILCLQELGGSMLDDLEAAGIDEVLPYHVVSDEATQISNGGRNGIWSVAPMDNVSTNLLPIDTSSMPAADISVGGRSVRVVSVHPNSPVRGAQDLWDEGLATIGQLQDYDHAYLIMGDFNSTWDHARFRELLGTSFVDAGQQSGEGFHMTFPSEGPVPPAVELDHIVYARDSGIVVSELETRHVSGTDHMALLGTLEAR